MKRKYVKPSINIDVFEASEYIATCAVAQCNIDINALDNSKVAYKEKNGKDGYQILYRGGDERFHKRNHACYKEFTGKLEQLHEYMYDSNGTDKGGEIKKVYYWTDGDSSHFTTQYRTTGSSTC